MTLRRSRQPIPSFVTGSPPQFEAPARQRLSVPRVTLALALLAGALVGGAYGIKTTVAGSPPRAVGKTWFAPYVDTTLTPTYEFQDTADDPARQVVLGFVVADPHRACAPSWGGYYTLGGAAANLNMDSRISQLRSEGIGAVVSFGGLSHSELAVSCTNLAALESAYTSVINRYHASTVDFDIEGAATTNWSSVVRRAQALHQVQKTVRAHGGKLAIWLTLPVEPSGLNAAGLSVVAEMLHAGVDLAGVNVMAMDYGHPVANMGAAAEKAVRATATQLATAYVAAGSSLSSAQLWGKLGVTVMIGENDDAGEQFTTSDATAVERFASGNGMGRVSLWSINRDVECGSAYGEIGVQSNLCSGVAQRSLQFDSTFAHLAGSATAVAGIVTPVAQADTNVTAANAPYPIWQPADPYVAGYKVVRDGYVYQAKWYNQASDPAAQLQYAWQTPWLLIGPVLPGEHAATTTTLAPSTYPAWTSTGTYELGDKVLFQGLPYQAKWYNQGDSPAAEAADPSGSPWTPLFSIPGEPTNSAG
jgi:chitinase